MKIRTNNVPRFTVDGWDVPADVRAEFDYIDWDAVDAGSESVTFVQYRGDWFDIGEFQVTDQYGPDWDGHMPDTFFSATVVRFVDDGMDSVVMGRAYA